MLSLRLQINLLLAIILVLFMGALGWLQIDSTRRSVHEEIQAAHRVATQVLTRVSFVYRQAGLDGMIDFLHRLGRVRANDIILQDDRGKVLYESPPSPYKPGRDAPAWFDTLVSPPIEPRIIPLVGGHVTVHANPSRAVLDGWDDLMRLLSVAVLVFAAAILAIYWLAGRVINPLAAVVDGLRAVGRGDYGTRLPPLPGKEGESLSRAFNGMAQAIEDSISARREAAEATEKLARNRELTQLIQARIEQERGAIARELHDEMGQSVTAIKSLALSIAQRGGNESSGDAARLIAKTSDHLYQVVHDMLPRLRPLALDQFGLADALEDLLGDWRQQHPTMAFELRVRGLPESLDDATSTAAYRIVQEAVTNCLRHAQARRIAIELEREVESLVIRIRDDGRGLGGDWKAPGHYGLIGMQERAAAIGGTLVLGPASGGGLLVTARLPLREQLAHHADASAPADRAAANAASPEAAG
jgi:two-component system, NarL family, sensor histidine kinase UhpB